MFTNQAYEISLFENTRQKKLKILCFNRRLVLLKNKYKKSIEFMTFQLNKRFKVVYFKKVIKDNLRRCTCFFRIIK